PFFGVKVPVAFVIPVAEIAVAVLAFESSVRQLASSRVPPISKQMSYWAILMVDVAAAAVLYDPPFVVSLSPAQRAAAFCLVHLLACLILTMSISPWRECLQSWVWRFRGRRPWFRDHWLGDRSENGLSLVTFAAIGTAGLVLLVLLPAGLENGWDA